MTKQHSNERAFVSRVCAGGQDFHAARQHHPDVNKDPSAEARFKEISEAYDVLSDPELRKRYDAFGEDFRRVPPDVDPEAWRQARAYAGAGAGGPGPGCCASQV